MKPLFYFILFSLSIISNTAFADEPDITYSIELRVDGERKLPALHSKAKEGASIMIRDTIGENPHKNEKEQELTFNVQPKITDKGLSLTGNFERKLGNELSESTKIDRVIQSGDAEWFELKTDQHIYQVVLKTNYAQKF